MSTRAENEGNSWQVELSDVGKSVKLNGVIVPDKKLLFLAAIHYNNDLDLRTSKEFVDTLCDGNSVTLDSNIIDKINSEFGEDTLVEIAQ